MKTDELAQADVCAPAPAQEPVCNGAPPQIRLEDLSIELLQAVSETEEAMQADYVQLVRDAAQAGTLEALDQQVSSAVESLRRTGANLSQAVLRTWAAEDELSARFEDIRKSQDRKWYRANPPANAEIDLEEKQAKHFAQGINLYKLFLVCFVGSFAGVVVEVLWCLVRNGYIESRSALVYGPFNPLYGVGAVLLTVTLYQYRNRRKRYSFIGGFLVGSVLEYVCSWGQELILGSRSWDYSNMPFNLNGRICLLYSIFWGILGVMWIKDIYPRMAKWILKLPNRFGKILTYVLAVFFVLDIAVTCVAVGRWVQRLDGQPATNAFMELIDERFPNERMEKVFANMEFIEEEE